MGPRAGSKRVSAAPPERAVDANPLGNRHAYNSLVAQVPLVYT
ncbi:MAG: hypothetical protein ACRENH_10495 [Gemmatimonadaceae bacterium]